MKQLITRKTKWLAFVGIALLSFGCYLDYTVEYFLTYDPTRISCKFDPFTMGYEYLLFSIMYVSYYYGSMR